MISDPPKAKKPNSSPLATSSSDLKIKVAEYDYCPMWLRKISFPLTKFRPSTGKLMKLMIFDIDGTLTNTQYIEDQCFKQAFLEVLGIDITKQEWHTLTHVTDWGITMEIYQRELTKEIPDKLLKAFENRFVENLKWAVRSDPSQFQEVPGASAFVHRLLVNPGYGLAIATGAWSRSAHIKLNAIGIPFQQLPFSSSDDLFQGKTF